MNVGEIAAQFRQTEPTISHHLGLLRRAGLVVARRQGRQAVHATNRCCLEKCTRRSVEPFIGSEGES